MLSKTLSRAMSMPDMSSEEQSVRTDFETQSVKLEPGGVKSVGLGIYNKSTAMPAFQLAYEPAMEDAIGVSLERLDITGKSKYMPFYQFHNFGDKPCVVTVSRQDAAA
jgi:hypothetical protein